MNNTQHHCCFILACALAIMWPFVTTAQTPLEDYVIKNLTTDDGLPMNQLNYMDLDQSGFLWIASFEGLIRYDGFEFDAITHQDYTDLRGGTFDVLVDRHNAVWAFDANHRFLFRYQNGEMHSWETDAYTKVVDYTLFKDWDGDVIFLGGNQFYKIVDQKIIQCPIPGLEGLSIYNALFADDGSLWVAGNQEGLYHIANGETTHYDLKTLGASASRITVLEQGLNGSIWAISSNNELLHNQSGQWELYQDDQLSKSGQTRDMLAEADDTVWIGTQNGMYRYSNGSIEKLLQYGVQDEDHIFSIALTKEGSVAYTTFNNGLKLLQKRIFKAYTERNGLNRSVARCIVPHPDGGYLIGSTDGVDHINTTSDIVSARFPQLRGIDITDIHIISPQDIYFATYGQGLYHYKDHKFEHITQEDGLTSDTIYRIEKTNDGKMLLGTYHGLTLYDGKNFESITTEEGLPSNIAFSLFTDSKQQNWISLASAGLCNLKDGKIVHFTKDTELENVTVFHLSEDTDGTIWGGYSGGILQIRDGQLKVFNLTGIFPRANIFHVWHDHEGHLWLTSNVGLYRINEDIFEHGKLTDRIPFHSYLKTDGLPSNNVTALSRAYIVDNEFWVPFNGGVAKIEPEKATNLQYIPEVIIDQITVNGRALGADAFNQATPITFEPGLRHLRISYTAPVFQGTTRTTFHTRLKGFDNWEATSRRQATYTNLPPGEYTFQVGIGTHEDNEAHTPDVSFNFTIKPYFHQTITFYILVVCTLLFAGYFINYLRLRASKRHQQHLGKLVDARTHELQRRSEELVIAKEHAESANRIKSEFTANISHEIRTPMNSIMGFADILKEEIQDTAQKNYLGAILKSGETLLTMIGDLLDLSKIEANKLTLTPRPTDLVANCKDTLQMFEPALADKDLIMEFRPSSDIPSQVIIDPSRFRQVILNLVSNAIKFTDEGRISIQIDLIHQTQSHAHIRCIVNDTGDGIPEDQFKRIFNAFEQASRDHTRTEMGSGLGLAISKRLVEMMHGTIHVQSKLGVGSTFTIDFPSLAICDSDENSTQSARSVATHLTTLQKTSKDDHFTTTEWVQLFKHGPLSSVSSERLILIIEETLIPALKMIDIQELLSAKIQVEQINERYHHPLLTKLTRCIHEYCENISIDKSRKLRLNLIEMLVQLTPKDQA